MECGWKAAIRFGPAASGDDVRRDAAGPLADRGDGLGGGDQVGEGVGGRLGEVAGGGLVALDVDAERGAGGAGAGEAEDDAAAALEQDADALVRAEVEPSTGSR